MSIRTLIEVNHDFAHRFDDGFVQALDRYLRSASQEHAEELERYGVRVIGRRHHADRYTLPAAPDGFPPRYLDREDVPLAEATLALLKAADSAQAWIRETVRGAKAQNSTIDVIAADRQVEPGTFWNRTRRVQRQLREAIKKARAAAVEPRQ